jgi:uncharacterized membrane protein
MTSIQSFLLTVGLGAAAIAVWVYVRFPKLAPANLQAALLHVGAALLLGRIIAPAALQSSGDSAASLLVVVLGVILPALVYAFLAGFWVIRLCQGMLRGGLR